jgi:hypothetical protein
VPAIAAITATRPLIQLPLPSSAFDVEEARIRRMDATKRVKYIILAVLKEYMKNFPKSVKYTVAGRVYPAVKLGRGDSLEDKNCRSAKVFSAICFSRNE